MDGCAACRKRGHMRYADAHHILDGGRRISHSHTIPLCSWHHKGMEPGVSDQECENMLGPSLARSKRAFIAEFGTETELLEETDSRYMETQIQV